MQNTQKTVKIEIFVNILLEDVTKRENSDENALFGPVNLKDASKSFDKSRILNYNFTNIKAYKN